MSDSAPPAGGPAATAAPGPWTTRRLLEWMAGHFERCGLDAPRLQAEHLLASVLGCERIRLYMEVDRPASEAERERLRPLVRRLAGGEPLQLVVGQAEFRGRHFACGPCTQVPQPCTGELVDAVLEAVPAGRPLRVLDLGCGTGIVGLTLVAERPEAAAVLVDVEPAACRLAAANAEALGVADRTRVLDGDLDGPLGEAERFDAVVGNLPYIPDAEWQGGAVDPGVMAHAPPRALRGGADGLVVIRRALPVAARRLRSGGVLALECADACAAALRDLVAAGDAFDGASIRRDEDGLQRAVVARRA